MHDLTAPCAAHAQTYDTMTRRYILGARLADASGELWVQVFNDQVGASWGI